MSYRGILGIGLLVSVPAFFAWGCGSNGNGFDTDGGVDANADGGGGQETGFTFGDTGVDVQTCVNLQCDLPTCTGTNTTTVTGTVYAPNGTLPLYNVIVYIPNAPLTPLPIGVTCDQCGADVSGNPVTVALTDSTGAFTLTNAPAGSNIPLVMQVGKWRREVTIPKISPCVANPVGNQVNGVEQMTRLPKMQSEGNMPRIAITTGGCEHFACIMPKLGIDPSEYAPGPTSSTTLPKTAFSFYSGGGSGAPGTPTYPTNSPPAQPFWNDINQLKNFDLAMLSCECEEPQDANTTSYGAIRSYLEAGGRIFTTDFMYVWYKDSSDTNLNSSPWSWPGGAPVGGDPVSIDTTFPKGTSMGDWLYYVSGIAPYKSEVATYPPVKDQYPVWSANGVVFDNLWAINPKYGLEWAHSGPYNNGAGSPQHTRIVTMGMPSADPPASQCGKGVHLDFHITSSDTVDSAFPTGCSNTMREPELVTTFMFFDIASCIQDDTMPPPIPN
jgi:hypothetical protein